MNGLRKDIRVTMTVTDEFGRSHFEHIILPAGTSIDTIRISHNGKVLAQLFPPTESDD